MTVPQYNSAMPTNDVHERNHAGESSGKTTFARDLGLFDATMIGIGAMIGAGIFVLTGIAAGILAGVRSR